jgi:hypothetical protein
LPIFSLHQYESRPDPEKVNFHIVIPQRQSGFKLTEHGPNEKPRAQQLNAAKDNFAARHSGPEIDSAPMSLRIRNSPRACPTDKRLLENPLQRPLANRPLIFV